MRQGLKEKNNDLELSIQRPTAVKQSPLLFLMEQLTSFFPSFHESCLPRLPIPLMFSENGRKVNELNTLMGELSVSPLGG